MKIAALFLVSASLGCASFGEHETVENRTAYECSTTILPLDLQDPNAEGKPLYFVESTFVSVTDNVRNEAQKLSITCVEDEPAKMFVGKSDPLGHAFGGLTEGFEVTVLVPNVAVSKEALVETRVKEDNLTVWFDDQKVSVAGRSD